MSSTFHIRDDAVVRLEWPDGTVLSVTKDEMADAMGCPPTIEIVSNRGSIVTHMLSDGHLLLQTQ